MPSTRGEHDAHDPERLTLIGELRAAIEHDELVLHYQPKLSLRRAGAIGSRRSCAGNIRGAA